MALETLDPIQEAAVKCMDRDILCDSKAGSGKTRVLMNRCLWLMENGVKPEEIMLVTFTNKAANEMMTRIKRLSPDGDKILCGTFHFIAMKYIREFAEELGYDKNFTILSPDDCVKKMKDTFKTYDLLHPDKNIMDNEKLKPKELVNAFSASRNLDIPFEEYLLDKRNFTFGNAEIANEIIQMYSNIKKQNNVLDFDDLLECFKELLIDPVINEKITSRFKHIMVDEYQDINKIQNSIIFYLRGSSRNLFVVGDPCQCIYGFRGSKIEYIRDFEDNYCATVFRVQNNYRSIQPILDVASDATGGYARMTSQIVGSDRPVVKKTYNNFEQADIAARQVKSLINNGEKPEEIAILVRSTIDIMLIEQALNKEGIGYVLRAGFSYFEKAHIKDLLMMLMTLINPKNGDALSRVLGLFEGFGAKTVQNCVDYSKKNSLDVLGLCEHIENGSLKVSKKAKDGALKLKEAYLFVLSATTIANRIKAFCDIFYFGYVQKNYPDDFEERISDIGNLIDLSKKYTDTQKFINESIVDTSVNNKETGDNKQKIVVSTIHRAKGLEWDNCIICNMANRFGSSRTSMDEEENDFEISEDARLLYVAITRARKRLLIMVNRDEYYARGKSRINLSHLIENLKRCRII